MGIGSVPLPNQGDYIYYLKAKAVYNSAESFGKRTDWRMTDPLIHVTMDIVP
jgi:hypothetical protein